MLTIIGPNNCHQYLPQLSSMHRLRKHVCVDQLNWKSPYIKVISGMEFDQFDTDDAYYLVHINEHGEVDAATRLIETSQPYLLGDIFPDLVQTIKLPKSKKVWETSRYCVDTKNAPKSMMGILAAGMLEFALSRGITSYVSISDIRIEMLIRRYGWNPKRLGHTIDTGTDISAAEQFKVSYATYQKVCRKAGVPIHSVITNLHDIPQDIAA